MSTWEPGRLAEELKVELILELVIEAICRMHLAVSEDVLNGERHREGCLFRWQLT